MVTPTDSRYGAHGTGPSRKSLAGGFARGWGNPLPQRGEGPSRQWTARILTGMTDGAPTRQNGTSRFRPRANPGPDQHSRQAPETPRPRPTQTHDGPATHMPAPSGRPRGTHPGRTNPNHAMPGEKPPTARLTKRAQERTLPYPKQHPGFPRGRTPGHLPEATHTCASRAGQRCGYARLNPAALYRCRPPDIIEGNSGRSLIGGTLTQRGRGEAK